MLWNLPFDAAVVPASVSVLPPPLPSSPALLPPPPPSSTMSTTSQSPPTPLFPPLTVLSWHYSILPLHVKLSCLVSHLPTVQHLSTSSLSGRALRSRSLAIPRSVRPSARSSI